MNGTICGTLVRRRRVPSLPASRSSTGPRRQLRRGAGAVVEPGTYLVICPKPGRGDHRVTAASDLAQEERLPVVLATTAETGTSSTSIKNYIQTAYDTWPVLRVRHDSGDVGGSYSMPT